MSPLLLEFLCLLLLAGGNLALFLFLGCSDFWRASELRVLWTVELI
jgi:hypothetical protein